MLLLGFVLGSLFMQSPYHSSPKESGGMSISDPCESGRYRLMLEWQQEQQRTLVVAILSSFLVPSLCHASCATLGCCAPPFILHERQVSRSEKTAQVRQDWGSGSHRLVAESLSYMYLSAEWGWCCPARGVESDCMSGVHTVLTVS